MGRGARDAQNRGLSVPVAVVLAHDRAVAAASAAASAPALAIARLAIPIAALLAPLLAALALARVLLLASTARLHGVAALTVALGASFA